ncbi:ras family-domain-containing protein [Irpex rosettiformis]|uniref:Ras family-domain-containing protein n=1 Tax=Irpex rosettiformis TaxID=378272 RepID=A0ACB8U7D6_9APHY|nr:ras family-domain-containing protein [Irpex rosettiformis]
MREQYLRTGEGFLLVYSIIHRQSFEQIGSLYQHILRIKDVDSCPAVIVANKCDLEFDRQVGMNEGRDLAKHYGCKFIETSAKVRINVEEAFATVVREIKRFEKVHQHGRPGQQQPVGSPHGHREDDGPAGCCGGCVVVQVLR